jgi:HD-like signal output (HDOD) protein
MRAVGAGDRDLVLVAALLHDLGKLVLEHAYPAYPQEVHGDACTADERVSAERRYLGIDHAAIGGFLLRRFEVAGPIARAVEGHHAAHARGPAAVVRLADMLAHYAHAQPVEPKALGEAGRTVGFTPEKLRATMFELSHHTAVTPRAS